MIIYDRAHTHKYMRALAYTREYKRRVANNETICSFWYVLSALVIFKFRMHRQEARNTHNCETSHHTNSWETNRARWISFESAKFERTDHRF